MTEPRFALPLSIESSLASGALKILVAREEQAKSERETPCMHPV